MSGPITTWTKNSDIQTVLVSQFSKLKSNNMIITFTVPVTYIK